ncbi:hypothetical protein ACQBAT_05680 [Ornithinimicrobium sp. Y1847]|uniref:hypothetical protein n=1 Tax=unclassified Ornithinimicrobium TaxID=2615080 RepID=UPI003B6744E1
MKTTEKIKLESWLTRYDFWLDSRGVPVGVRSALGKEMRANITEAAADVGLAQALAGVGTPKELATQAAEGAVDPTRPRWLEGVAWATLAAVLYGVIVLVSMITFYQGVAATGAERGTGWALLVPGMELEVVRTDQQLSLAANGFPWLLPVLAVLAFLAGARVWRLAIPRDQRQEKVRLPRAVPETGPRWLWGVVAAFVAYLVLSAEVQVDAQGASIAVDPLGNWVIALSGAVVAFLLIAQPWRARRD